MGTRGAYGFRVNDVDKLGYTHWGGCIDGAGLDLFQFIQELDDEELQAVAQRIVLVDEDNAPTPEQIEQCKELGLLRTDVSSGEEQEWYCLLRNAQGDLHVHREIDGKPAIPFMLDNGNFPLDSLFCEGAYIINMDTKMLEIYEGFNKEPGGAGRYASVQSREYYGVRLVWEVPFDLVRNMSEEDFVAEANRKAGNG